MAESRPDVAALVAQMPETDQPGQESKFTGPSPEDAAKVFDALLAGGPAALAELIALLHAPGEAAFKSYRAEYLLHGAAVYTGRPGREAQHKMVAQSLAQALGGESLSKGVRVRLVRELQAVGGPDAVAALARSLGDEALCEEAVAALVAIGAPAAESLRAALPATKGRCRVSVIQALGTLRDAGSSAAIAALLRDESRDVRMAAAGGLARIGDPAAVDRLIAASNTTEPWERIQAAKACLVLAETLLAAGKKAEAAKVWTHLRDSRTDESEAYVRQAASAALAAAGQTPPV